MVFVRIEGGKGGENNWLVMAHQAGVRDKGRGNQMKEKFTAQERIIEILLQLEQNHVFGLSNKEIARLVGTSEANTCRDMQVLEKYELASKNESGRWRFTPRFGQMANSIMKSFQTAKLKLTEDEAQFLAAMR